MGRLASGGPLGDCWCYACRVARNPLVFVASSASKRTADNGEFADIWTLRYMLMLLSSMCVYAGTGLGCIPFLLT